MTRSRSLAERVASIGGMRLTGVFLRHAALNRDALAGGSGGRWGESFPVIYLGRPAESCVEEAYRHLVDDTGVAAEFVKPRTLYTLRVVVENILDLRDQDAQLQVGLASEDLASSVGDYESCQRVAAIAHQLEYHGIIAPAATGLGETLALFRRRISTTEMPVIVSDERWLHLPARPGTAPALRVVRG